MQILNCSHLSYKYDSQHGIKDVSFSLESGDYLCLVGENGSGKSTLMKCILGLIKPSEGKIEYMGISRSDIGYLPQQRSSQKDFPASVYEVVRSGCLGRHGKLPFFSSHDRGCTENNLKRLGIYDIRKKSFSELSGGQRQRVLLARALCAAKKMILLDEPVTGLDPKATDLMYDLLRRLNKESGITVVMISHDVKSAVNTGGKILHMAGKPLFFGSASEYAENDLYKSMIHHSH